jgi:hypothetical protein
MAKVTVEEQILASVAAYRTRTTLSTVAGALSGTVLAGHLYRRLWPDGERRSE